MKLASLLLCALALGCSGGDNNTTDAGNDAGNDAPVVGACSQGPRSFWTWNLAVMPPADVQTAATCHGESAHAYVFVSDDVWNAGTMTQDQVTAILDAFENHTPRDATRGSYTTDVQTFGDPPDVDGDPHVYLFYTSLGVFNGQRFDGFFRDIDESATDPHSNHIEMLHMDPTGPSPADSDYMLGIIIHEFVHLINYKYDNGDEGWLSEALAESAMALGGYNTDLKTAQEYVKIMSGVPLCVSGYSDYGATFSWGTYMLDRWGTTFLRSVLQDPAHGIPSVAAHLPNSEAFADAFGEFTVAANIDQHAIGDGRYGYVSAKLGALGGEAKATIDGQPHSTNAEVWTARSLRFTPTSGSSLSVTLASSNLANLKVFSFAFDPANPAAGTVTPQTGATFSVPFGSGQVVDLIVAVTAASSIADSQGAPVTDFTYTATAL
jgi:hypothetical protein